MRQGVKAFSIGIAASVLTAAAAPKYVTPASVLEGAPASAWKAVDPTHLMVMELKGGGQVSVLLANSFAPAHVANIERMVRAGYFDGLAIMRVQDGYVTQWGDPDEKKPLPKDVAEHLPAEYELPAARVPIRALPYRDTFAAKVGWSAGWPVASDGKATWLTHCYGMVGVARGSAPDTGSGAELYTVIGQAPRQLDRNITVVGRILAGMELMTARPRGGAEMGFYKPGEERLPIVRVRMASDIPAAERPRFVMLDPAAPVFAPWVHAKANRKDGFYILPAGAIDLCSALPPVKPAP